MSDNVIQDKLADAHDDEAERLDVEFRNWGWVTDETSICSKTTKGILTSEINPKTMQVRHHWITYEEKARRDEQQQREMLEGVGKSVRDHVVRQLKPLREVYADLPEFAPIWEAIDKLEGREGAQ